MQLPHLLLLFLIGLQHGTLVADSAPIRRTTQHADDNGPSLQSQDDDEKAHLVDKSWENICKIFPYWPIAEYCAENTKGFCLATPQNAPFICADKSTANCPQGLTGRLVAERSGVDLTGKVALVTGGRSGSGYQLAEALLSRGCKVVIASRDVLLNKKAVLTLKASIPGADVSYMIFDLASFDSVRNFAASFLENHDRLDYYFGNSGTVEVYNLKTPFTIDGFRHVFQVNYVAQVLLLELLLPLLRASQPSRILLTSSSLHMNACDSMLLDRSCWGDEGGALAKLVNDHTDLVENPDCQFERFFGFLGVRSYYYITKFLLAQAVREVTKQEADLGNQVYAFAWGPGVVKTFLNPVGWCCLAPSGESRQQKNNTCPFFNPYVGPRDIDGRPDPPKIITPASYWTSPAHGAMGAMYAALVAGPEQSGSYFTQMSGCEPDGLYFPQGITPTVRSQVYNLTKSWAGIL